VVQQTARIEDQVAKVADRLASEYADRVPDRVVRDLVRDAYVPFLSARVTQFVPVLVDRSVRENLRRRRTA
jgi:cell pole-organizing protein PopZ